MVTDAKGRPGGQGQASLCVSSPRLRHGHFLPGPTMAKLQPSKSWLSHYFNCFPLQQQKEALGKQMNIPTSRVCRGQVDK